MKTDDLFVCLLSKNLTCQMMGTTGSRRCHAWLTPFSSPWKISWSIQMLSSSYQEQESRYTLWGNRQWPVQHLSESVAKLWCEIGTHAGTALLICWEGCWTSGLNWSKYLRSWAWTHVPQATGLSLRTWSSCLSPLPFTLSSWALLKSLWERFAAILRPDSPQFDATPAAACLLDPNVSLVLQTPDMEPLRRPAQSLVPNLAAQYNPATPSDDHVIATQSASRSPPAILQKYHFLASLIKVNGSLTNEPDGTDGLLSEIKKYSDDVKHGVFNETPLQFWTSREAVYPNVAPVALDLVSAPASQAFAERIFSVCGLLSSGLRKRMAPSLEQRVFLKINELLLDWRTLITLSHTVNCCT